MKNISEVCALNNFKMLDSELNNLKLYLEEVAKEEKAVHEVEKGIWSKILEIGFMSLGWFLKQQGDGDVGEKLEISGKIIKRSEKKHRKKYKSIFGEYVLERYVYGERDKQKIEAIPLDAKLQLPESEYSYLLQEYSQMLSVESPYNKVSTTLEKIFMQKKISVDSLERMNQQMAKYVPKYRKEKAKPKSEEEGEYLVAGADCKGIPIKHERDEAKIHEHKRKKGPKPDRKRMSTVGVVYTVDPFIRTGKQILESLFCESKKKKDEKVKRPKPKHKEVYVALTRKQGAKEIKATDEVFDWMAKQVKIRDPKSEKTHLILMDGQLSLWEAAKKELSNDSCVEILDLLHVTPRLWEASQIFFPKNDNDKISCIKNWLLQILDSKILSVIEHIKDIASKVEISSTKKKSIATICQYFKKNQHRMQYREYLEAGYPIATGVIEGACRHFVKDRFERAGMKWTINGAQSMLELRTTYLNEQWDNFIHFRIRQEQKFLYPYAHFFQINSIVSTS